MVQISLPLHLLWKAKTDNTRYSLAEQGSGLEGQLQCWSATQVISGSHSGEIKDTVTLSCKTQKGQTDQVMFQTHRKQNHPAFTCHKTK